MRQPIGQTQTVLGVYDILLHTGIAAAALAFG